MTHLIDRLTTPLLLEALAESRGVAIVGPRQVGKTTLARDLLGYEASYTTLDDPGTLAIALDDPTGFIADLASPAIIDEIQRAPDLMLAIKMRLDTSNDRGQYLITGSANLQTLASIRDALPGRVQYVRLWPFAQAELRGGSNHFIDQLFDGSPPRITDGDVGRRAHVQIVARGGYPEAQTRSISSLPSFFTDYIDALTERDIPELSNVRVPALLGRLLRAAAARSSGLLSSDSLARDVGVDRKTVDAHLRTLRDMFLIRLHPAWHTNLSHREIKTPKLYVTDSGLMTALIGADERRLASDPSFAGHVFETFVVMELVRLSAWSADPPEIFHFRDRDRHEVDVILERRDGSITAIAVKSSATPHKNDFRAMARIRDAIGDRFRCGVVLNTGSTTLPFGDRLFAVPMSSLWS